MEQKPYGGQYPHGVTLKIEENLRNSINQCNLPNLIYVINGNAEGMKPEWRGLNGYSWIVHNKHDLSLPSRNPTNETGYQYLMLSNGELYKRRGYNIGYFGGGAQHLAQWDNWENITPKSGNYFTTPESEGQYSGNLDNIKKSSIIRTKGDSVSGTPQVDNKWGIVQTFIENTSSGRETGFQVFVSIDGTQRGEIFTRTLTANIWTPWKSIKEGFNNFIAKPESLNKYTGDFNTINQSSIFRAGGERGNRPIDSSEGIIQTLKGEGERKAQTWYGLSGNGKGLTFTRIYDQGQWTTWRKLMTNQDIKEETFRHHTDRIDDIKTIQKSGYYHTTNNTQHLPEELDADSKNGILLIINKDRAIHYEYTPITGKFKGFKYVGDFTQSRAGDPISWVRVASSEGHIKVHDTRSQTGLKPKEYHEHTNDHGGGYILYEWKWGRDIQLDTLTAGNNNILLQTIIPEAKETEDESLINQIAFDMVSQNWYYRKAQDKQGENWGQWTQSQPGGSSIPQDITVSADLKDSLINLFNNWADYYKNK